MEMKMYDTGQNGLILTSTCHCSEIAYAYTNIRLSTLTDTIEKISEVMHMA